MKNIRSAGFTLMELIIVIVLMGILSATVVINIGAGPQHSVAVQADQFRRNLSHIQLMAISRGVRLKLAVASGNYTVCAASAATCNSATAINDPVTNEKLSVTLTDGVVFTQGTGSYYFDSLGRPVSAATGSTLVSGASTLKLNGVGRGTDVTVTVLPITGFARTSY